MRSQHVLATGVLPHVMHALQLKGGLYWQPHAFCAAPMMLRFPCAAP